MPSPQSDSEPVQFLFRQQIQESEVAEPSGKARDTDEVKSATRAQTGPLPSDDGTPQTSVAPSENDSTQPTTPSSAIPGTEPRTQQTPTQPKNGRSFAPAVPVIPAMPTSPATPRRRHRDSVASVTSKPPSSIHAQTAAPVPEHGNTDATASVTSPASEETSKATSPRPPKSWADLVRSKAPGPSQSTLNAADIVPATGTLKPDSLADVLTTMSSNAALHPTKLSFLEPKGLVNTGNMCYMNSILQILTFCVPFYEFLDRLSRDAVHSLKSDTPLIDAMILFMKEYRVIDSATSAEKLRLRLRQEEVEQYGDAFIPENVYEVIRTLPRFRDMRRGHQQDAQEFLGFLLEELHEECAFSLKKAMTAASEQTNSTASEDGASRQDEDGWMEVGVKQKASTTRASGVIGAESPITKIFGGKLRSELRIPGVRQSNTVEPFESLQLDIGSPQINNIIDALKGLSKPEAIPGEFNSPRGKVNATKQVYIEQLPPVLILHLKRFQYDNATKRTEKIWKKIGYPLNLEIPREAFPVQVRNKMLHHGGIPQYRLTGVIYHHGRNASGGHYTVDVRRQDGIEWIRLDDTVIRRVRAEDVAGGGGEEDLKVLAEALERHNEQAKLSTNGNIYDSIHEGNDDEDASDKGWSQVNGTTGAHSRVKSTASAVNGVSSPAIKDSSGRHTPSHKNASAGVKDNKVAYLLFYQKVGGIA